MRGNLPHAIPGILSSLLNQSMRVTKDLRLHPEAKSSQYLLARLNHQMAGFNRHFIDILLAAFDQKSIVYWAKHWNRSLHQKNVSQPKHLRACPLHPEIA
jgi:hypothetical protein